MANKLNTHTYDGELKNALEAYQDVINESSNRSDEYDGVFEGLRILIDGCVDCWANSPKIADGCHPSCNTIILRNFDTIVNSLSSDANHDKTNDMRAGVLLYIVSKAIDSIDEDDDETDNDYLKFLRVQLYDMRTGMCPQGRTHRLFQLVSSMDPDWLMSII